MKYNFFIDMFFISLYSSRSCNTHYQANCENDFFHKRCIYYYAKVRDNKV